MVQEKIIAMLAESTDTDASEITAETSFADLGIDSLDITEMAMDLEDEFGITLEMNPELNTVGKLVAAVEALVAEA